MEFNIGKGGDVEIVLVLGESANLEKGNELFSYLKEKELFKGSISEVYADVSPNGSNIILLGLGEEGKLDFNLIRRAFYKVGCELMKYKVQSVGVTIPRFGELCYRKTMRSITEGLLQSEYGFEKYLTKKKTVPSVKEVYFNILEDKKNVFATMLNLPYILYGLIRLTWRNCKLRLKLKKSLTAKLHLTEFSNDFLFRFNFAKYLFKSIIKLSIFRICNPKKPYFYYNS